jgi:GNAT superfamily N-acetyltransferase
MTPHWPLLDRLLYYTSRLLERLTGGRARIVRYYFVAQRVPDKPLAKLGGTAQFFNALPGDETIRQALRPERVISRRFQSGARCFAAASGSELAGFIWIKESEYLEDEVRCLYRWHPRECAAWDFDVYVSPQYRGTRVFARLWEFANQFLRARGYLWTISRISAFNPGSLAAHRRIGLVPLSSGTFFVLGNWQLSFYTRAPFVHLSLHSGQVPTLSFKIPGTTVSPAARAALPQAHGN